MSDMPKSYHLHAHIIQAYCLDWKLVENVFLKFLVPNNFWYDVYFYQYTLKLQVAYSKGVCIINDAAWYYFLGCISIEVNSAPFMQVKLHV